jgi:hypothetical protein
MRKRPAAVAQQELERCDPTEPRELAALQTNIRLLRAEIHDLVDRPVGSMMLSKVRDTVLRSQLRGPLRRIRRAVRASHNRLGA